MSSNVGRETGARVNLHGFSSRAPLAQGVSPFANRFHCEQQVLSAALEYVRASQIAGNTSWPEPVDVVSARKVLSEAIETLLIVCGFRQADGMGEFRATIRDHWIDISAMTHWLADDGSCWLAPLKAELELSDDRLRHYRLRVGRRLDDGSLERLSHGDPTDEGRKMHKRGAGGPRTKPTVAWFDLHPLAEDAWFFDYSRTEAQDRTSGFTLSLEALNEVASLARELLSYGDEWQTTAEPSQLRNKLLIHLEMLVRTANHELLGAADGTEQFAIRGDRDELHIQGTMFCLVSGLAYFEIDLRIEQDCLVHWACRYQPHDSPRRSSKYLGAVRGELPHRFHDHWVVDAENDVPAHYRRALPPHPPW